MNRRSFLALAGGALAYSVARPLLPDVRAALAAIDRTAKWPPQPTLLIDWRYAAGRIVDGSENYGFVVSLTDIKAPSPSQQLLVERQLFSGDHSFHAATYHGTLSYDSPSATYTFRNNANQVLATWQLDSSQIYQLSVATPELTLQNVALRPQGDLIPEGGDGSISVGHARGFAIDSDYYADWARVEIGGVAKGVARVDMQGLRPATLAAPGVAAQSDDYDHYWFAVAGQAGGEPVWISAWRIEDQDGPLWDVTIARGSGGTWRATSYTEQSAVANPLAVRVLAWQPLPANATQPGTSMGAAFHLAAGQTQPGDLLNLTLSVPPGQFVDDSRLSAGDQGAMLEAVGLTASGSVLGLALSNVSLVVAESTAEFYLRFLPLMQA